MNTLIRKIFAALMLLAGLSLPAELLAQVPPVTAVPADGTPVVTLQTFYDQMAPYGQWVNMPNYGYVFIPSVAPGFQPYVTAGHWVYNDQYGWTWASDYPWGWAAFHYGRWNYDPNYGWFWIPDLNWGPAWVAWRNCDGYYGWAPLPWGTSINVGFAGDYGIVPEHWCFVPQEHLCEINLGVFFVPRAHNIVFIQHSAIINRMDFDRDHHFGYFKGPDRVEVEGYMHHPVTVVRVEDYRRVPDYHHVDHPDMHHDDHQDMHRDDHHDDHQDMHHDDGHAAPGHFVEAHDVPHRGGYR